MTLGPADEVLDIEAKYSFINEGNQPAVTHPFASTSEPDCYSGSTAISKSNASVNNLVKRGGEINFVSILVFFSLHFQVLGN